MEELKYCWNAWRITDELGKPVEKKKSAGIVTGCGVQNNNLNVKKLRESLKNEWNFLNMFAKKLSY